MIKLFIKQYIYNRCTLFSFFCIYSFLILILSNCKHKVLLFELLLYSMIKYGLTFIFLLPSLYITHEYKNNFINSYHELKCINKNISLRSILIYYILSMFTLSALFSLPIFIYEFFVFKQPNVTYDTYLLGLMLMSWAPFFSQLLFYTCFLMTFMYCEPKVNHNSEFILVNVTTPAMFVVFDENVARKILNGISSEYIFYCEILYFILIVFLLCCLSFLLFKYCMPYKFKNYINFVKNKNSF